MVTIATAYRQMMAVVFDFVVLFMDGPNRATQSLP